MSDFNTYFLMKEPDVIDYVQAKLSYFDADAPLACKEIGDGNLNYVFRVWDERSGRSIIVKQAGEHLRISDKMTLTTDRGRIEASILKLQGALCPGLVPEVYLYDGVMCAMIMEDMIGHTMMRTGLIHHEIYPKFPEQISTFLVNSLLMTTDIVMDHQKRKALVREFTNPELCDITENLVFGEPLLDYNGRNDVFPPVRDFVKREIYGDEELRAEVARLKFRFMNHAQSLIHGDLHTGSVFINKDHTFVFDPEFAFFGPMGYDIGNVIANLFFAWANGNATIDAPAERARFCGWCMCAILEIVDLFKEKFCRLYDEQVTEPLARSEEFKQSYLADIMADTAGYAGTECIRRIVGMAHNKDITVIEDMAKRASAEKILLTFAKDLILHQRQFQTANDYYRAMEDAIRAIEPDNPLIGPKKTILDYDTVALDDEQHALVIIDQTKLSSRIEILSLTAQEDIWDAIYLLKVRGAPAIGVAAALGIYLGAREIAEGTVGASGQAASAGQTATGQTAPAGRTATGQTASAGQTATGQAASAGQTATGQAASARGPVTDYEEFLRRFREASAYLNSSRPTAVNLSWALQRMENVVLAHKGDSVAQIVAALHDEALAIREEDILVCQSIGKYGLSLVKPGDGLLTHCNAGQLATVKYGTATAPMYLGQEKGYHFKVYCDETRPLLQGARLTSFELFSAGLDVTLLCDNMSASLMREGKIQAVFVGCDRVAKNGDTANKIGTSMAALAAKRYGVPFYVCAPTSTIDMSTATGDDIVIEQRKPEEVTDMWYEKPMTAPGVKVYNPAFDVTDHDLITGIVTEFGIAYPPYEESFQEIFLKKQIRDTVQRMMKDMDIK